MLAEKPLSQLQKEHFVADTEHIFCLGSIFFWSEQEQPDYLARIISISLMHPNIQVELVKWFNSASDKFVKVACAITENRLTNV